MQPIVIQQKIYEVREQKVMLDVDLAQLYEVETRVLNQAVKRNRSRFPADFMFQLTKEEWDALRLQTVTGPTEDKNLKSQTVISSWGGTRKLPYAFTEHGVAMLASILHSEKAMKMSIAVVRAFIALKQYAMQQTRVSAQLEAIRHRLSRHDAQLKQIYEAIEKLLDEKATEDDWEARERIGFKYGEKLNSERQMNEVPK